MSTSTDAMLFYGYHLPEEVEVSEEAAASTFYGDAPVQIGYHCSQECEMPYVFWAASQTTARRGYPESIAPDELAGRVPDRAEIDEQIQAFAQQHSLPGPGEPLSEDWPDDKASDIGWWLASWWG